MFTKKPLIVIIKGFFMQMIFVTYICVNLVYGLFRPTSTV